MEHAGFAIGSAISVELLNGVGMLEILGEAVVCFVLVAVQTSSSWLPTVNAAWAAGNTAYAANAGVTAVASGASAAAHYITYNSVSTAFSWGLTLYKVWWIESIRRLFFDFGSLTWTGLFWSIVASIFAFFVAYSTLTAAIHYVAWIFNPSKPYVGPTWLSTVVSIIILVINKLLLLPYYVLTGRREVTSVWDELGLCIFQAVRTTYLYRILKGVRTDGEFSKHVDRHKDAIIEIGRAHV